MLVQPYVPGSPRTVVAPEDLPWWGGALGREVIDRFVNEVPVSLKGEHCQHRELKLHLEAGGCFLLPEGLALWECNRVEQWEQQAALNAQLLSSVYRRPFCGIRLLTELFKSCWHSLLSEISNAQLTPKPHTQ